MSRATCWPVSSDSTWATATATWSRPKSSIVWVESSPSAGSPQNDRDASNASFSFIAIRWTSTSDAAASTAAVAAKSACADAAPSDTSTTTCLAVTACGRHRRQGLLQRPRDLGAAAEDDAPRRGDHGAAGDDPGASTSASSENQVAPIRSPSTP